MMSPRELVIDPWQVQRTLNRLESVEGVAHSLDSKTMQVLVMLLEANGEVVSLDELLNAIRKDRVVEPGVVHQKIRAIRAALNDNAKDPKYIETMPKSGYRILVGDSKSSISRGHNLTHYWYAGIAASPCAALLFSLGSALMRNTDTA